MFKLVKTENRPLTRDLALQFKAMPGSPTERDLNPLRVKHLKEKIVDAGWAIPFNWATATHKGNGEALRLNGQHSSDMLAGLDEATFPSNLTCHLDEYEVANDEDLALLFRQFDDRKSSRTPADVAGAYQGLQPVLRPICKASVKLAAEGVNYWRKNVAGVAARRGDDVYQLISDPNLHPFFIWVGELFDIKTPELQRVPIVAAMHATYEENEEDAKKFWHDVARGGRDYEDSHPTTVLDNWLKKAAKKEREEGEEKLKPADYYQGCIYAFNAFFEGKTLRDIKHDWRKGFIAVKS